MKKNLITNDFLINAFSDKTTIEHYKTAINEVGLWEAEKIILKKYTDINDSILDLGCGAGRTTFGLFEIGYHNILGTDFSENMITAAKEANKSKKYELTFEIADARNLPYQSNSFDVVFFSFSGLTQIPYEKNRIKAIREIRRVLNKNGFFIFTTLNRENEDYTLAWQKEEKVWDEAKQDPRLEKIGDKILFEDGREYYIHIPKKIEVIELMQSYGYELVEGLARSEICNENEKVKEFSDDSIMWVFQKK